MKITGKIVFVFSLLQLAFLSAVCAQSEQVSEYNVKWNKLSVIPSDGMPVGNGSAGAVVSAMEGGKIWVLLRHVDAWSEAHRLLKPGDIEITVTPDPFKGKYTQELLMNEAAVVITGDNGFRAKLWIDANNPVMHIVSQAKNKFKMDVKLHDWRTEARQIKETNFEGVKGGIPESADIIFENEDNSIVWCHHNNSEKAFDIAIRALEIPTPPDKLNDILNKRTFGAMITGESFTKKDAEELTSTLSKKHDLNIYILSEKAETAEKWENDIRQIALQQRNYKRDFKAHAGWWKKFWDKSYIHLSGSKDAEGTSAGYAYVMYLNALAGRGIFPIIWNGSIFAPPTKQVPVSNHTGTVSNPDPDYRAWGNLMLHQNLRLPYYPMFAAGQFDLSKPFIDIYHRGMPLMKEHTKAVFGHEGMVIRESTTLWGIVAPGVYGIDRSGLKPGQQASIWHRTHWQAGLEVAKYMADYYQYTQSREFAADTLIPFASEVVKFFDVHWPHKNGKLFFPDVFVMETFRHSDNPMPFVAGLRSVLNELLALPEDITSAGDRAYWEKLLSEVPEIPVRYHNEKQILANAASVYSPKVNAEVGELYAVFPYHLYGVGLPDLDIAQQTYPYRTIRVDDVGCRNPGWAKGHLRGGWRQEVVMAALLGLTDTVKTNVAWHLQRTVPQLRFPGFFQTTYDGIPDVQHGGMGAVALQKMILQEVDDKIIIAPAWPDDWNCEFRLYAKKRTIVEGKIVNGRVEDLKVFPVSRKKDVFIGQDMKPAFQ